MTNIHAAIGRVQLTKINAWTKTRQENAAFFDANIEGVVTPKVSEGYEHVYHQYTIRIAEDRDASPRRCVRNTTWAVACITPSRTTVWLLSRLLMTFPSRRKLRPAYCRCLYTRR